MAKLVSGPHLLPPLTVGSVGVLTVMQQIFVILRILFCIWTCLDKGVRLQGREGSSPQMERDLLSSPVLQSDIVNFHFFTFHLFAK